MIIISEGYALIPQQPTTTATMKAYMFVLIEFTHTHHPNSYVSFLFFFPSRLSLVQGRMAAMNSQFAPAAKPKAAPPPFASGQRVEGDFAQGGQWFGARVVAVHAQSTGFAFDLLYDDGDSEQLVPPDRIRAADELKVVILSHDCFFSFFMIQPCVSSLVPSLARTCTRTRTPPPHTHQKL